MKRKILIILVLAACLIIAASGCGTRISERHTDIIGVTTIPEKNTVIMNAKTDEEFVSGTGKITVGEGERIHVESSLETGSVDLALHAGDGSLDVFTGADLENLPVEGDVFGISGLEGDGSFDLDAAEGEYSIYFALHDAAGNVTVSTKAD